ncbi:hypothetical protein BV96_04599 [Sphingomonas paucimobilis]|nr:hypothetical protein BV96_04599 [Sphingomonas paucimobilis]
MTSGPGEGWKVFADGDGVDDIPLWKMLAKIRSDDLDEGLNANAAFLNRIKPPYSRNYNLALAISSGFGFLSVLFLIGLVISLRSEATDFFFYLTLTMLAAAMAPHLWRQAYQYGLKIPEAPLDLRHASDQLFDEVLAHLQKVDGPHAYYLSRFRKKRIPLNRRQFFGRLRYFLFSEHSKDRAMVMRFPTAMSLPADLYLHRDDVEKILAASTPKRAAGPGRKVKYAYIEAAFDLRADPRLNTLELNDEAAAIHSITDSLLEWFQSAANVSADVPDRKLLTPYARKIFNHLKNRPSREGR